MDSSLGKGDNCINRCLRRLEGCPSGGIGLRNNNSLSVVIEKEESGVQLQVNWKTCCWGDVELLF